MKRKLLAWIVTAAMLLPLFPAAGAVGEDKAPDDAGYGFTYRFVTQDTIEITSYSGYEPVVNVPSSIDGFTVVGIAGFHDGEDSSDANPKFKKVILPDTVTYIAEEAFEQNQDWAARTHFAMEEIVLPESLKTIGERAFYGQYNLKKITIPASVTEIGTEAFAQCNTLDEIVLENENTRCDTAFGTPRDISCAPAIKNLYNDWVFAEGTSDFFIWNNQLLAYKGESKTPVIPDGVTVIGAEVFENRDITSVTIPNSVRCIGNFAFRNCSSLEKVDIPASVERIENGAFSGCSALASVTFRKGLTYLGEYAFDDCTALTKIDLPDGLTEVGDCAFSSCEAIEHITFPASLTKITYSAIQDTKWYLSLPENTEVYCGSVFLGIVDNSYHGYPSVLNVRAGTKTVYLEYYLEGLNELNLPDGLESLTIKSGYQSGITTLNVPESVNSIDIRDCQKLTTVNLPKTAKLEQGCFSGCSNLQNMTIPKGNTILKDIDIGKMESLTLPDDVLEFSGVLNSKSLKSVDLGSIRVLDGGLSGCTRLESVTLPDTLIQIGNGSFNGCKSLKSIQGGKNVKEIGIGAFEDCIELTNLGQLAENVCMIGSYAFENSGWYHDQPAGPVYFGKVAYTYKYNGDLDNMPENTVLALKTGTVSVTDNYIFEHRSRKWEYEQNHLVGLVLPESCKIVGNDAFANCPNLKSIDFGGTQYVGYTAFNGHGCESIVLPDSMRYIGNNAFSTDNLKAIHLNEGLKALEEGAFFTYGLGKGVTVPSSVVYLGQQCLGYAPNDPDDMFGGVAVIDNFVIRGTKDSAAEQYAKDNEIAFQTDACASHDFVKDIKQATCQAGGFTRNTCAICGTTSITDQTQATGHTAVNDSALEATCTRPGYTGGSHCASCGAVLSNATATQALGHDWVVTIVEDGDAEASQYYGMERHYCRRCEVIWYQPSSTGHVHDYRYMVTCTAATCTTGGSTVHHCKCGASYTDEYTAALGHNFVNGICSRCGASDGSTPSQPDTPTPTPTTCDGGANCPSKPYYDVDTTQWYHLGIDYAIQNSLMNGVGNGQFDPNGSMTRAMLVTVLWRYNGSPEDGSNQFADVPNDQWYTKAVAWASHNGVVNGVGNGQFDPNGRITREQMATILYRYAASIGIDTAARGDFSGFGDRNSVSSYAVDALSWCIAKGIINGTTKFDADGIYLDPQGSATRAQVAAVFMRYIENVVK